MSPSQTLNANQMLSQEGFQLFSYINRCVGWYKSPNYCNGGDATVAAFRGCGPTGSSSGDWVAWNTGRNEYRDGFEFSFIIR